jgi:hypothetical protein
MARAVGVGRVFLKAQDPKALSAWYAQYFGIALADGEARACPSAGQPQTRSSRPAFAPIPR